MSVIKHELHKPRAKKKTSQPVIPITEAADMSGIEGQLADLAHAVESYVAHACNAENKLAVFTGPTGSGYHPVLVAIEPSDTMDRLIEVSERIATAFERIATALEKPEHRADHCL